MIFFCLIDYLKLEPYFYIRSRKLIFALNLETLNLKKIYGGIPNIGSGPQFFYKHMILMLILGYIT